MTPLRGHMPSGSVSARAGTGFDAFVARSVEAAFAGEGQAAALTLVDGDALLPGQDVVMLTISSYLFRMLVFIHVDRDPALLAHLASLEGCDAASMEGERFEDAILERGNLCCGALNRDLAEFFPHTGMSTPCKVDRFCLAHVKVLGPAHVRRWRVQIGDTGATLHFTLAVCAYGDLDFAYEARRGEEATAGELEMF